MKSQSKFFESIFENSDAWEVILDCAGNVVYSNSLIQRITGYSLESYLSGSVREEDFILRPDISDFKQKIEGLKTLNPIQKHVFKIQHLDGRICSVSLKAEPLYSQGEWIGSHLKYEQVSGLDWNQSLTPSFDSLHEGLTDFLQSLDVGITITDENGKIVECNPASERILGISRAEQLSRDYDGREWFIVRPDLTPMPAEEFASVRALEDQIPVRDQVMGILKDEDRITWISVTATPSQKKGLGVIITYIDITNQKNNDRLILAEKERFDTIMNSLMAAIYVTDLETEDLLFANQFFIDLFGEIENKKCYNVLQKQTEPCAFCKNKYFLEKHRDITKPIIWEFYSDIKKRWFLIHDRLINWMGTPAILKIALDITDKKEAEIALIKSEIKYKNIIETTSNGFLMTNRNQTIIEVNPIYLEMSGYSLGEILGMNSSSLETKPSEEETIHRIERILDKGYDRYETYHRRKNGELYPVEVDVSFINLDDGFFFSFIKDITERKEAERALLQSESKTKALLNSQPDLMFLLDEAGTFLEFYSPTNAETYVPDEMFLGKRIQDVMPTELVNDLMTKFQKAIRTKELQFLEYSLSQNNVLHSFEARILHYESNKILTIVRDITKKKTMEENLLRSQRNLREAQKIGNVGHWEYHFSSKIWYWSDQTFRIHELEPQEIELNFDNILKFIYYEDRESVKDVFLQSLSTNKDIDFTHRIVSKSGKIKYLKQRASIVYEKNGDPVMIIGSVLDITELKEKEEELQSLNHTKDKLFSIISHDLRNPFGVIQLHVGLLESDLNEDRLEKAKQRTKSLSKATEQASNLILNLLNWSRTQMGKITIITSKVELQKIVQEVIADLGNQAEWKMINFIIKIPENLSLYTDSNLLKVVLRNLLSNAMKFSFENGQIEIMSLEKSKEVVICISDEGIGIKSDQLKKIFDLDSNETTRGTKGEAGSGLGLILCKEFIDLLGGKIWAESTEGKGSTFKFSIPLTSSI